MLNQLPSHSYMSKILTNKIDLEYSLERNLEYTINANIKQFFQQNSGFYQLMVDEIVINSKTSYDYKLNEFDNYILYVISLKLIITIIK